MTTKTPGIVERLGCSCDKRRRGIRRHILFVQVLPTVLARDVAARRHDLAVPLRFSILAVLAGFAIFVELALRLALGRAPRWKLPDGPSETLHHEWGLSPLPTGSSRAIECAKPGINRTLVGLRAQLVTTRGCRLRPRLAILADNRRVAIIVSLL